MFNSDWEVTVYVNDMGSMTTHRSTFAEACAMGAEFIRRALRDGWKVNRIEITSDVADMTDAIVKRSGLPRVA